MAIDAPVHTNESNLLRIMDAGLPFLLVFWKRPCAACDQLEPALSGLARRYSGRALVVKVNAEEEAGLAKRYGITQVPSTVFISGGTALATAVGAAGEKELAAWLEYMLGGSVRPDVPGGAAEPLRGAVRQPAGQTRTADRAAGSGADPMILTDASFDQVVGTSEVPVLVDFWAVWCGPCKMVAPAVAALAQEFKGRALVGKLDVDQNPAIAGRYGIMSIPTLLIFRNGQIVDRIVGAQPATVLRQRLAQQVG